MNETPEPLAPVQKRDIIVEVEARGLERMKKEARVSLVQPKGGSTFTIECDEGKYLMGDDSAPFPLAYFSSSLAF